MSKVIYAATPFRMQYLRDKICNFIESKGNFPLHPLLALPYERFNYERHNRETIYRVCFGLVDLSNELWIFGIGTGSLEEWKHAKGKPRYSFVKQFDPNWEEYIQKEKYNIKYKEILEEILLPNNLSK
ncbi:MAG: hypothetical protein PHF86_13965 [Candidatus Nanoarchaeia archaeon]|nr:hypothetical protein [Candidatus Nanoarchaeia archaeon]